MIGPQVSEGEDVFGVAHIYASYVDSRIRTLSSAALSPYSDTALMADSTTRSSM